MSERLKRVEPIERPIDQNLTRVAQHLLKLSSQTGPNRVPPQEFRIQRTIDQQALEALAQLPFEVLLTEHDAGTTLLTGEKKRIWADAYKHVNAHANMRTKREARYTLHNHPNSVVAPTSAGDRIVSRQSFSEVDFILGREGVTIHKRSYDDDISNSDRDFSLKAILADLRGKRHALRYDLKHGYADAFISFAETKKIQAICDYMNGTETWSTYKDVVMSK